MAMNLKEIENRKNQGLSAKPIDDAFLLNEIIANIKDVGNKHRAASVDFFIYNVLPGTTSAAAVKADFLKQIILKQQNVEEVSPKFAFELLGHMKGGPSIKVLLDIAFESESSNEKMASEVMKTQDFLYEADMERLVNAHKKGNKIALELLESYAKAEFFTKMPEIPEKIELVTFVAGIGDISTDLLSPGSDAHSRSDRELHGQCMFDHNKEQQKALLELKEKYPKIIKEVRGKGLLIGLCLHRDQTKFIQKLMVNKLLTVRAAENVVRLLPPLNVTKQEINLGLKILDKVCKNYR